MFRCLLPVLLLAAAAPAADLPPPDQLPSRPELPDPLVTAAGKRVTTKGEWESTRRPELLAQFHATMYGRPPAVAPAASAQVLFEDTAALGGTATLREVAVTMAAGARPVHVLIAIPNKRSGPVPAFVGLNFSGNHALTDHSKVRVPDAWMAGPRPGVVDNKATDAGRNKNRDVWPLEAIVGRGYAVATAYYGEVIPDNPKVRGGLADVLMPPSKDQDATGAVLAWAWGLQRMGDYLGTLPEVDGKRLAVVGHSRLGKAALAAGAFGDRFAVVMPHQSGCGGAGPSRTNNPKAEPVSRITTAFPHWFAPRFAAFGADPTRLPFDQNAVVALCAPRPVLLTNATDDPWANPGGQFAVLKGAAGVYSLYSPDPLAADAVPPEGRLVGSRLGYWVRAGKHSMTPADWDVFLGYADKWLK